MKIKAPAKINIYLKVLGRRPDGYHELRTIMVPVCLFDEIRLEPANTGVILKAEGCDCALEDNFAYKAARLFLEKTNQTGGVSIEIEKHIPIAAGLGGGSSDAASVLLAMNDMFHTGLGIAQLSDLAGKIGADCPFFLFRRPLLMGSRGDEVLQEVALEERSYLLVIPPFGISTARVYSEYKSPLTLEEDRFKIYRIESTTISPEQWLENDLEATAFDMCPELKLIKAELLDAGALGVLMSGSGSSVFGVFENEQHLCGVMSCLQRHGGYTYMPTTRLTGERYGDYRGKGVSGQG